MSEMNDIVKLAVDSYKGSVEKYSIAQSQEALRQAAIELNGGSSVLNYRNIRDGKCNGLFTLIEEIIDNTVAEGLTGNEFFMNYVDYRNVAEGDKNLFLVEDDTVFTVGEAANGTQAIRRQRLAGVKEFSIPTTLKAVRIYEELNRVLSGRVDFNDMITKVSEAFERKLLEDIYALWMGATAADLGGASYFPVAGAYSEDALLDVIAHVEAAADGKTATIVGTNKALRKLAPSIQGTDSANDLYHMGYYGSFFGTPVMAVPQRHKVGSTDFIMRDDVLTVVAGDDKPIKVVHEGSPLIIAKDPTDNMDLTQEYFVSEKWGAAIVLNGNHGIGRYEFT